MLTANPASPALLQSARPGNAEGRPRLVARTGPQSGLRRGYRRPQPGQPPIRWYRGSPVDVSLRQ